MTFLHPHSANSQVNIQVLPDGAQAVINVCLLQPSIVYVTDQTRWFGATVISHFSMSHITFQWFNTRVSTRVKPDNPWVYYKSWIHDSKKLPTGLNRNCLAKQVLSLPAFPLCRAAHCSVTLSPEGLQHAHK